MSLRTRHVVVKATLTCLMPRRLPLPRPLLTQVMIALTHVTIALTQVMIAIKAIIIFSHPCGTLWMKIRPCHPGLGL